MIVEACCNCHFRMLVERTDGRVWTYIPVCRITLRKAVKLCVNYKTAEKYK